MGVKGACAIAAIIGEACAIGQAGAGIEKLDARRPRGRAQTTEYDSVNPIRLEYQSSPLILYLELIDESRQNYVEFSAHTQRLH